MRVTTTSYEDGNRRIVTRSDNVTPNDQQLAAVTLFDQLGRVRLTRQLEAANPSQSVVDDDAVGIKVQTRYGYAGNVTWQKVSNPYRASVSTGAGSEPAPGWTVTASDWSNNLTSVTVSSGAAAPGVPSISNCGTAGSQISCYAANTVTSVDEALKGRTSTTDALGRLTAVSETGTNNGNVMRQQIAVPGLAGITQDFGYDGVNRLTTFSESGVVAWSQTYGYDAWGNRAVSASGGRH